MYTPPPDDPQTDQHDCRDGWLEEDFAGRPRPCPLCRPHIAARRKALARQLGIAA